MNIAISETAQKKVRDATLDISTQSKYRAFLIKASSAHMYRARNSVFPVRDPITAFIMAKHGQRT
jgi:hypothetical protein